MCIDADPVGQKWRATMRKRNLIPFLKIVIKKGDQQQLVVFCCCYYTHTTEKKWNQPYFATICQMDTRLVDITLHNLGSRGIRRLLLRKRLAGWHHSTCIHTVAHLLRLWPLPFCQLCSNWIANDRAPSVRNFAVVVAECTRRIRNRIRIEINSSSSSNEIEKTLRREESVSSPSHFVERRS